MALATWEQHALSPKIDERSPCKGPKGQIHLDGTSDLATISSSHKLSSSKMHDLSFLPGISINLEIFSLQINLLFQCLA